MSGALLRETARENRVILAVFTVVSTGYLMLIMSMFDPDNLEALKASIETAPPALAAAVGMNVIPTTLTDFAANYFYGFLVQLFLVVHVILLPLRLVVRHVDRGSMAYLLSTPTGRVGVAGTQAFYMVASLAVLALVLTGGALAFSAAKSPGAMDVPAFVSLNLTTFLLSVAMASITFFFSCVFDEMRNAAGAATAVLVTFFVLSLVSRYGHGEGVYGTLDRLSIFHLLPARAIVMGEANVWLNNGLLLAIAGLGIGGGMAAFRGRDLHV
jgi:ABC-2 type transport system permease protein